MNREIEEKVMPQLLLLKRENDIQNILSDNPAIAASGQVLNHRMVGVMMRAHIYGESHPENATQAAITNWRGILEQYQASGEVSRLSQHQAEALQLSDEELYNLFTEVNSYFAGNSDSYIQGEIHANINDQYGYNWQDKNEARQTPKKGRTLESLRENGVTVSVPRSFALTVKNAYETDAQNPLLYVFKDEKIFLVNKFPHSKGNYLTHDIVDHFWIYDKLDRLGILTRYEDFLQRIGNPQITDIFKREGELVATVGHEWRASHHPVAQFPQIVDFERIIRIFQKDKNMHRLSSNQRASLEILRSKDPQSIEAIRFGAVYSGILTVLLKQRRKYGYILDLDQNYDPKGVLPLIEPEHLALVVETTNML